MLWEVFVAQQWHLYMWHLFPNGQCLTRKLMLLILFYAVLCIQLYAETCQQLAGLYYLVIFLYVKSGLNPQVLWVIWLVSGSGPSKWGCLGFSCRCKTSGNNNNDMLTGLLLCVIEWFLPLWSMVRGFASAPAWPIWQWPAGCYHRTPASSGCHWGCHGSVHTLARWSRAQPPGWGTAPTLAPTANQKIFICWKNSGLPQWFKFHGEC